MSIIAINGKISSGKDTVGRIIQYLTSESGDPNSSRYRSYEEFLSKGGGSALRNFDQHYVSDWEIKKFAGKLKQTASLLTGIPVEKFEDQEFKKQYMPEEWAVEIWNDPDPIEGNDYRITSRIKYEDDTSLITYNDGLSEAEVFDHEIEKRLMTYREFLQKLGTEAMRDGLHTNVWVNALFADYKDVYAGSWGQGHYMYEKPNWIITDMRFPNEMKAVKKRKGITTRVVRPTFRTTETEFGKLHTIVQPEVDNLLGIQEHPSETALDDAEFDYEILNNSTIEDLVEKMREILIKEQII